MFVHTRSSAPKRFDKFGWQTRTFCHKKVAKVIAKLESDRLYNCPKFRTCHSSTEYSKGKDFERKYLNLYISYTFMLE